MRSNRRLLALVFVVAPLAISGRNHDDRAAAKNVTDRITQVSVINALMVGRYDGVMPIEKLMADGDFGLGTLDHLDGELIVLEGQAFQARGDGSVAKVARGASTPFAVVTPFDADGVGPCPHAATLAELDKALDEALGNPNLFLAVRIDGTFPSITLRSVPAQRPPYRPLAEVAKGQSVWTRQDVRGTLIGIRSPAWVTALTVPGFHWHFLAHDRRLGGHVLDCRVGEATVRHDFCREWLIRFDESATFGDAAIGQDLRRELRQVESSRGDEPAPKPKP